MILEALHDPPVLPARAPYSPPRTYAEGVLRLDRTERPFPLEEYSELSANLRSMVAYPSTKALEARFAERFDIASDHIIATAGADEAIDRTCRATLRAGDELLTLQPTFEMIGVFGRLAGIKVVEVRWLGGEPPVSELLASISDRTKMIALVSPNNPTAAALDLESVLAIVEKAPQAVILVDQAYIEFSSVDPTTALLEHPNILITRTMSKAWGMPGLRIGYAIGHPSIIRALRESGGPYSVSGVSIVHALNRLATGQAEMESYVRIIQRERAELTSLLTQYGCIVIPSEANFLFIQFADAVRTESMLEERGIAVRSFLHVPGLDAWRRITCPGNDHGFAKVTSALKEILS